MCIWWRYTRCSKTMRQTQNLSSLDFGRVQGVLQKGISAPNLARQPWVNCTVVQCLLERLQPPEVHMSAPTQNTKKHNHHHIQLNLPEEQTTLARVLKSSLRPFFRVTCSLNTICSHLQVIDFFSRVITMDHGTSLCLQDDEVFSARESPSSPQHERGFLLHLQVIPMD